MLSWLQLLTSITFLGNAIINTRVTDAMFAPFTGTEPYHIALRWGSVIFSIYTTAAWTFPITLSFTCCMILRKEFTFFAQSFRRFIDKNHQMEYEKFLSQFEKMRVYHTRLCG